MKTDLTSSMKSKIDNTLEMSSICRGEWCRSLESEVDRLDDELRQTSRREDAFIDETAMAEMSDKIQRAYRNLGPDIHL